MDHHVYLFDGYTLDPQRRSLMRGAHEVILGSRALDLLIALVDNADAVLSRDYLVARVWPTTVVEESSLRVHVAALRRTLEDGREEHRRIVNVPGRGYRFAGPVSRQPRAVPSRPCRPGLPLAATALPLASPTLVGRDPALAAVEAMLGQHRIVTLAGLGGIGKTSLALQLLSRQAPAFAGHVHRVDLSQAGASASVAQAVADSLGQPPAELLPALGRLPRLLLLDNCEHVVEDAAAFAEAVTTQAPRVQLVCTSREPLHVADERVVRLKPLANVPRSVTTLEEALQYPAVALLVERATAMSDTVRLDDDDVPHLRALCELLDGVPLAIELAAARVHTLGLQGLVARPDDLLDVLTRGRRTAAPRHRTLRALVDWSHDLLDADEQRVFSALSLFDGTFSLTSATAVLAAAPGAAPAEQIVLALVDKSMLLSCPQANRSEDGTCFRMPNMLRRYGRQRLADRPDAAQLQARHAQELQRVAHAGEQARTPTPAL